MDGMIDGWIKEVQQLGLDEWIGRWMDGWMGWLVGWMDWWMD